MNEENQNFIITKNQGSKILQYLLQCKAGDVLELLDLLRSLPSLEEYEQNKKDVKDVES